MTWAEPLWLTGLVVPLIFIALEWRRREAGRGKVPAGLKRSDGSRKAAPATPRRNIYGWLALACLLVALARPQVGYIELPVFKKSRQVIIALDVSNSMLTADIPPSRLERSRLMINTLLEELGEEQVGLILFAGTAFLQCPLSADYEILQEMLVEVGPAYIPRGGTNYQAMLSVANEAFGTEARADRFLIVFSDGESLVPGWEKEAEKIAKRGVQVITLGVGTSEGGLVPDPKGGYIKKSDGGVVLSRLESKTLEDLARRTGGRYVDAARWVDLGDLVQATIEQGRAGEVQEQSERIPLERFQIPLACALFFLFMRIWREIPVQPRLVQPEKARDDSPSPPPVPVPETGTTTVPPPLPVMLFLIAVVSAQAQPQVPPPAPGSPAPTEKLATKVAELSNLATLGAEEFRDLGQATISAGNPTAGSAPLPRGSIEDALDAVARGRQHDPDFANWDEMERILKQMLEPPPEPPRQQQDPNQSSESGDNQSQSGPQQPSEGGENNQTSDNNSQSGQDSPSSDNQESSSGQPDHQEGQSPEGKDNEANQEPNPSGEDAGSPSSRPGDAPEDSSASMGELSQEPQEPPVDPGEAGEQQTVQGSSSGGELPEGLEADANLRALFSRAGQIKNADQPGLLFQRLQEESDQRPKEGKDW